MKSPRFDPEQYQTEIQDNEPLSSSFAQVRAVDEDVQEPHSLVKYAMIGDSTAMEYFMVDDETGFISLKKSVVLDRDKRTEYDVSDELS